MASNLGIAVAYAAFGDYAERHQWLPLAMGAAIGLPILIAMVGGQLIPRAGSRSVESDVREP